MQMRETITLAVDALRANKVRAILTSLGVIIGSASIVLVVTVALTSRKFVISQIEAVGSNLVWAELLGTPDKAQPFSYEITLDDMAEIKAEIPGVVEVAGINDIPTSVVVNGKTRTAALIGVTEGYQAIRRLVILRGRYFDFGDMESRSKVCLITRELAERVFGMENPVGKNIRMGELTFTVIGVFRERVATFGLSEIEEDSVIIPFTLIKYYTGKEVLRTVYAQASAPEMVPVVQRKAPDAAQEPPSRPGGIFCAHAGFHPDRGAHDFAGADHLADRDRLHRSAHQRGRHHEYHAGYGNGAHAGDWPSQGRWCRAQSNSLAIPD